MLFRLLAIPLFTAICLVSALCLDEADDDLIIQQPPINQVFPTADDNDEENYNPYDYHIDCDDDELVEA